MRLMLFSIGLGSDFWVLLRGRDAPVFFGKGEMMAKYQKQIAELAEELVKVHHAMDECRPEEEKRYLGLSARCNVMADHLTVLVQFHPRAAERACEQVGLRAGQLIRAATGLIETGAYPGWLTRAISRQYTVRVDGQVTKGTASENWPAWSFAAKEAYLDGLYGDGQWTWWL